MHQILIKTDQMALPMDGIRLKIMTRDGMHLLKIVHRDGNHQLQIIQRVLQIQKDVIKI